MTIQLISQDASSHTLKLVLEALERDSANIQTHLDRYQAILDENKNYVVTHVASHDGMYPLRLVEVLKAEYNLAKVIGNERRKMETFEMLHYLNNLENELENLRKMGLERFVEAKNLLSRALKEADENHSKEMHFHWRNYDEINVLIRMHPELIENLISAIQTHLQWE